MWFGYFFQFEITFYRGTPKWPLSEFFNSLSQQRNHAKLAVSSLSTEADARCLGRVGPFTTRIRRSGRMVLLYSTN